MPQRSDAAQASPLPSHWDGASIAGGIFKRAGANWWRHNATAGSVGVAATGPYQRGGEKTSWHARRLTYIGARGQPAVGRAARGNFGDPAVT